MNNFFYWSGFIFWIAFGMMGMVWVSDTVIEWLMESFEFKREFLHWFAEKLKARHPKIPAG